MRIIFFGTSEFAVPALKALKEAGLAPATIVTSPDRPAGRGQEMKASPVKELVKNDWLNIMQPEAIDEDFISKIYGERPDVGVVAAYGKILPKILIDAFPRGILNIHPSLLPKYRGSSPLEYTILAGEEFNTGVTVMSIDEQMDHGPIVAQKRLVFDKPVPPLTYTQLHDALADLGARLLIEILPGWIEGTVTAVPQNHEEATFTKLIKKEDGKVNWSQPPEYIERMIRAYEQWPGTYTDIKGTNVKLLKVEAVERHLTMEPGTIFEKDGFPGIACGERGLKLLEIQPEGKTPMPGDAWLRGHRDILS